MKNKNFIDYLNKGYSKVLNAYSRIAGFVELDDVTLKAGILQMIVSARKILKYPIFEQLMLSGGIKQTEELTLNY